MKKQLGLAKRHVTIKIVGRVKKANENLQQEPDSQKFLSQLQRSNSQLEYMKVT